MTRPTSTTGCCSGLKGTMSEAELHFIRARLRGGQLSKARRGELLMPAAGRAGLRPGRAGRARPRHRRAGRRRAPVHHVRPHRLGPRGRQGVHHRRAAVPGPGAHRARQGRAGLDAAAALAGAAHPAQPALRRRVRLRPAPRTPHRRTARRTRHALRPRAVDRADPRRPPRLHQLGHSTRPTSAAAANAPAHGADRARRPSPRRTRAAARPGHLRPLRQPDDRALPHPPRRRGPRLPLQPRTGIEHGHRAARPSPAPASTPPSASCCSTPSPRSRSRSRSPCKPNWKPAPPKPTQLRRHHVERARHHADLARRRYLAVDPDNRLVADSLEADWNDALRALTDSPRRLRTATPPPQPPLTADRQNNASAPWPPTSPTLWTDPAHPATGTQTHGPPAARRRHPQPRPSRSPPTSGSPADSTPPSPSRSHWPHPTCGAPPTT